MPKQHKKEDAKVPTDGDLYFLHYKQWHYQRQISLEKCHPNTYIGLDKWYLPAKNSLTLLRHQT
jgi:hypothetical protein